MDAKTIEQVATAQAKLFCVIRLAPHSDVGISDPSSGPREMRCTHVVPYPTSPVQKKCVWKGREDEYPHKGGATVLALRLSGYCASDICDM